MRKLVIPDIHGCAKTLIELLHKIGLNKTDELYFLGDYIDKGRDSAGVIDTILSLKESQYQLYTLRGNHEENLIEAYYHYNPTLFQYFVANVNKSANLLDDKGALKTKYLNFFNDLPYYFELDDFWLVHAGFDTKKENVFASKQKMLEIRGFTYDELKLKNKTVVHGHQVTHLNIVETAIKNRSKIIPLDNGCVYTSPHHLHDYKQLANLVCLDLSTFNYFIQPNIDGD